MNYIKKLEMENREKDQLLSNAITELAELRTYIHSDKFRCGDDLDGYVNIKDINGYIERIMNAMIGGY